MFPIVIRPGDDRSSSQMVVLLPVLTVSVGAQRALDSDYCDSDSKISASEAFFSGAPQRAR